MAAGRLLTVVALAALALAGRTAHAAPSQQATAMVMIQGFKFDPAALTVAVGTTVTWVNHDQVPHTASSVTEGKFDTGTIDAGASKAVTLNEAGTFEYFCKIHPNMKATLTVTAAAAPAPAPAPAPDVVLGATLMGGAEEVPNPGDPDGSGTAMVTLKPSTTEVCYELKVSNITLPAAAAHIHRGAKGAAGPVVVPFTAPGADGMSSGCAKADAALITEIAGNPAGFYVNVHTSDFPGGAVRGQLAAGAPAPAPAPPAPAPAPAAPDVVLGATLAGGSNEVPNPGDPDGSGTAMVTLKPSTTEVCYELKVSNITLPAAAAHIHRGARGVAGPVVVPFTAPAANGMSSGCAKADLALITEIAQNPAGFYVNVHTSDFPGGAVRGQLAAGAPAPAPVPPQLPVTGEAPVPAALPNTGASDDAGMLAVVAMLMLLAGLGLSWSTRRRRAGI
jgi:LPXTG-motif cell wall-anchored protein